MLTLCSYSGAPSSAPSPIPASLPNSKAAPSKAKAAPILPDLHMSSSVLMAAAISVPLSILIAVCLAVRRCRKRGRGHLVGGKESGGRKDNWGVGKLLKGRDREGFKPLDTEERDGMLDDDSDSEVILSFFPLQLAFYQIYYRSKSFQFQQTMPRKGHKERKGLKSCLWNNGICDKELTHSRSAQQTILKRVVMQNDNSNHLLWNFTALWMLNLRRG